MEIIDKNLKTDKLKALAIGTTKIKSVNKWISN